MLKPAQLVKATRNEVEALAINHLQTALAGIPFLSVAEPARGQSLGKYEPDIVLPIEVRGDAWTLICEVKQSGQPRYVREGAFQLRKYLEARAAASAAYGVFIAPYLSAESTALLREESLGYLDFAGNCFLSFDGVFIERSGSPHTPSRRRELRELFAPKASRVLRVMFTEPERSWRVTELADRASVSLGQASNVRRALLDREWAGSDSPGLKLKRPGAIVDAWRSAYKPRLAADNQFYTLLHGKQLEGAITSTLASTPNDAHLSLASFSAAQWLAPYVRSSGTYFYADEVGLTTLSERLELQHASRGANIFVAMPQDDDVYLGGEEPVDGMRCTGALQTYLDLTRSGDRGGEAADHLRKTRLEPEWSKL